MLSALIPRLGQALSLSRILQILFNCANRPVYSIFPLPRRVFRASLLFGRERTPAIVPNDLIIFLSRRKSYAFLSFVAGRSIPEIKNCESTANHKGIDTQQMSKHFTNNVSRLYRSFAKYLVASTHLFRFYRYNRKCRIAGFNQASKRFT